MFNYNTHTSHMSGWQVEQQKGSSTAPQMPFVLGVGCREGHMGVWEKKRKTLTGSAEWDPHFGAPRTWPPLGDMNHCCVCECVCVSE